MKRLFVSVSLVLVVLLIVMVVRAERLKPEPSASVPPATPLAFDQAGALARFVAAVQVPTESRASLIIDTAAITKFTGLLQTSFPRVHAALTREVLPSGALLFTWKGRDPAADPVILMGHMDVVPADPATLDHWKHPPYSGDIADGAVWGRGTLDDKAAVLSLLEASETLLAQGFTPARTILFAFGDDEENGGHQGAAAIVQLLKSRGVHAAFVVDEGGAVLHGLVPGVDRPVALIGISEKGYMDVALSTTGAGGHSSEPPVHTAIGELAAGLARLESHPFPASLPKPVESQLLAVAPYLPFSKRLALANLWLLRPLVIAAGLKNSAQAGGYHTTTAEDIISGGIKSNALPTNARAIVNFRILPGETVASVLDGIRTRVADSGIDVAVSDPTSARNPSPVSPTDTPGFRTLHSTIQQFYPSVIITPYLVQGATDSSYYYALSPNVYRFAPIEGDLSTLTTVHGFNERMATSNYIHAVQFEAQLLQNIQ